MDYNNIFETGESKHKLIRICIPCTVCIIMNFYMFFTEKKLRPQCIRPKNIFLIYIFFSSSKNFNWARNILRVQKDRNDDSGGGHKNMKSQKVFAKPLSDKLNT